jgi:hypothetical protein
MDARTREEYLTAMLINIKEIEEKMEADLPEEERGELWDIYMQLEESVEELRDLSACYRDCEEERKRLDLVSFDILEDIEELLVSLN